MSYQVPQLYLYKASKYFVLQCRAKTLILPSSCKAVWTLFLHGPVFLTWPPRWRGILTDHTPRSLMALQSCWWRGWSVVYCWETKPGGLRATERELKFVMGKVEQEWQQGTMQLRRQEWLGSGEKTTHKRWFLACEQAVYISMKLHSSLLSVKVSLRLSATFRFSASLSLTHKLLLFWHKTLQ